MNLSSLTDSFLELNPIIQALLATTFTWLLTAAGASLVFFFKELKRKWLDTMLGFTGGVMVAASYWSLLAPAIEMAEAVLKNEDNLYCLGDIVHNNKEVERLNALGLKIIDHNDFKVDDFFKAPEPLIQK